MSGVDETSEEALDLSRRSEFVRTRILAAGKLRERFTEGCERDHAEHLAKDPKRTGAFPYPWVFCEAEGITMAFLDFVRRVDHLCQDSEAHASEFGDTPSVYVDDLRNALFEAVKIQMREDYLKAQKEA